MSKKLVKSPEFDPLFNRLIDICDERNTSVSSLLDIFATSRSAISAWKKGNISANIIADITDYLGVSTEYFLKGHEALTDTSSLSKNVNQLDLTENEQELTDIEEKLLKDFRSLSQQGQDYIRQQMFMAREVYKNNNLPQSNLNAG